MTTLMETLLDLKKKEVDRSEHDTQRLKVLRLGVGKVQERQLSPFSPLSDDWPAAIVIL